MKSCDLQLPGGKWQSFPGEYCIFLEDGSFVTSVKGKIKRFKADNSVMWEKKIDVHHQMNLSTDGKRILVLAEEVLKIKDKKVREDIFVVLDLEGKLLSKRVATNVLKEAEVSPLMKDVIGSSFGDADIETSHFNSIYEIPENEASKKLSWAAPGNIIVNSIYLGMFVISSDLSKVLHHEKFDFSRSHNVHDVQMSSDGQILLFNNLVQGDSSPHMGHSAAQKYDPVKKAITFEFTGTPREIFNSPIMGSIQEVEGVYVIGHMSIGGFVYSPKEKKIIDTSPPTTTARKGMRFQQQVKLVDVQKFLAAREKSR